MGSGRIDAVCVSRKKGERKKPVCSAWFQARHGIRGDAHAGAWHRQVSLLCAEDIETVRRKGLPDIAFGDFAENVVVSGLNLNSFGIGTRLRLGSSAEITITQIGKECHSRCRIYHLTGDCIMPRLGLFAQVDLSGEVRAGDSIDVLDAVPRGHVPSRGGTFGTRENSGTTLSGRALLPRDPPVLGICGYSGSGKTTLIEALLPHLRRRGARVAVVKHDVHGIDVDRPGKDSDRLFRAGADVFLQGNEEELIRLHGAQAKLSDILTWLKARYDLVLVEGRKNTPIPKVWLLSDGENTPPPNTTGILATLSRDSDRVSTLLAVFDKWLSSERLERSK